MRTGGGIKIKDKQCGKLDNVHRLAQQGERAMRLAYGDDYSVMFAGWETFLDRLLTHQDRQTKMRAAVARFWWDHERISTAVAHGRGILKPLSQFTELFGDR